MPVIKGAWLAQQQGYQPYDSALKQGTGVNPIHAVHGGAGRGTTPGTTEPVPETLVGDPVDDYGYCDEDTANRMYGYGPETGLSDRPSWGESDMAANTLPGYPAYGPYEGGRPGGTPIRSIEHGARLGLHSKAQYESNVLQGEDYKSTSYVNDADISDPSQYVMQTSMTQRDKTRAGSQASGTANEYDAPIRSRIPGMRARFFGGPERHADMEPKAQDVILRPFWNRTAGTGDPALMKPNELYQSTPYSRTPPPDAYQGPDAGGSTGGFTDEDPVY